MSFDLHKTTPTSYKHSVATTNLYRWIRPAFYKTHKRNMTNHMETQGRPLIQGWGGYAPPPERWHWSALPEIVKQRHVNTNDERLFAPFLTNTQRIPTQAIVFVPRLWWWSSPSMRRRRRSLCHLQSLRAVAFVLGAYQRLCRRRCRRLLWLSGS